MINMIAQNIQSLRDRSGLTQEALGEKFGPTGKTLVTTLVFQKR